MKRNKIIKLIMIALLTLNLFTIFTVKKQINKNLNETQSSKQATFEDEKVEYDKVILERLRSVSRLEIGQISGHEEVEVSNCKNSKLFHNCNILDFKAVCHLYINFDSIGEDSIIIKDDTVFIFTNIEKEVEIVDVASKTDKGFLSFYERKYSSEEFNDIQQNVKGKILDKVEEEDYNDVIKRVGEDKIEKLINRLTNDRYEVKIVVR